MNRNGERRNKNQRTACSRKPDNVESVLPREFGDKKRALMRDDDLDADDREAGPAEVTRILHDIQAARLDATDLLPVVYRELRRIAAGQMQHEASEHTLQPTALVHEAYLRLMSDSVSTWDSRGHFFAAAAEAMRRILIESARRKKRIRHGGTFQRLEIQDADSVEPPRDHHDLLALDTALTLFAQTNSEKATLVKLRYFAGLTEQQAAETLGISRATAARWWAFSRAWLLDQMRRSD